MKKNIISIIVFSLFVLIAQQFFWYKKLKGNLAIYMCNVSEKDSIKINLYLDNEEICSDIFVNNSFYSFKNYSLTVFPGKHELKVKTSKGEVIEKHEFYTSLIKRLVIEYQGKNNQLDDDKEFLIQSEFVFRNLIIQ